ncbi:MAG TPA: hypothetical protein VGZ26_02755, partial [Pirellulales bacterium]|jgi:hypothetical protein|nr:hypothetical protein [Pirellulales bacterium]
MPPLGRMGLAALSIPYLQAWLTGSVDVHVPREARIGQVIAQVIQFILPLVIGAWHARREIKALLAVRRRLSTG